MLPFRLDYVVKISTLRRLGGVRLGPRDDRPVDRHARARRRRRDAAARDRRDRDERRDLPRAAGRRAALLPRLHRRARPRAEARAAAVRPPVRDGSSGSSSASATMPASHARRSPPAASCSAAGRCARSAARCSSARSASASHRASRSSSSAWRRRHRSCRSPPAARSSASARRRGCCSHSASRRRAAINFSLASGMLLTHRPRRRRHRGRRIAVLHAAAAASRAMRRSASSAASRPGARRRRPRCDARPARAPSLLARRAKAPHDRATRSSPASPSRSCGRRGAPPWPALVFVNGATPDGRAHPMVLRLSIALARTGHLVFIPDLPGIAGGELSPATLAAAIAFTRAAGAAPEAANGRVALAGVSVGASLALLVAADPTLADRDLGGRRRRAVQRPREGDAPGDHGHVPRRATARCPIPYRRISRVGLARSLAAMLPATPATAALCAELRASTDPDDPLGARVPRGRAFREAGETRCRSSACWRTVIPARFDDLFAALPAESGSSVEGALAAPRSADGSARRSRSRRPRGTRYFPVAESRALVAGVAARPAHGDVTAGARDTATEPALPRRARSAERLLRPRARLGRWAAGAQG